MNKQNTIRSEARRDFLQGFAAVGAGVLLDSKALFRNTNDTLNNLPQTALKPVVISTWEPNVPSNKIAAAILEKGGRALDAVEQGVRNTESDPNDTSVGLGGYPDREGKVTLDASIMDEFGNAGAVAALEQIEHPVSVARLVMEKTPHVLLVGEGALQFALKNGIKKRNLLTPQSKKEWEAWKQQQRQMPAPHLNNYNHDTIGMLALDQKGNLSGACSTSGWAFKLRGRVGDSPIIGAGLFVDNEVGAVSTSGLGEINLKMLGCLLVTEYMRAGKSPQTACELVIERMAKKIPNVSEVQIGFVALNKQGETGVFSLTKGFTAALYQNGVHSIVHSSSLIK